MRSPPSFGAFCLTASTMNGGWGYRSRYSDSLLAKRSGVQTPVEVKFSVFVHTGPEAHKASCTVETGSHSGG
jgi:hypothetical protein